MVEMVVEVVHLVVEEVVVERRLSLLVWQVLVVMEVEVKLEFILGKI
jgi:hypothetical protein